jgi:hypothetical protein
MNTIIARGGHRPAHLPDTQRTPSVPVPDIIIIIIGIVFLTAVLDPVRSGERIDRSLPGFYHCVKATGIACGQ